MPVDPGLQPERTSLAWQRTTLACLACSLIIARLIFSPSPAIAILIAAMTVIVAAAVGWLSAIRYMINNHTWSADRLGTDARAVVGLTGLVMIIALGAAAYVVLG